MPKGRRSFRPTFKPQQPFINSYHLNQIPLPYYNPLQDPYLRDFFSLNRNKHQLKRHGLLYSSRKDYPYEDRREMNSYKHHRDNQNKTPYTHRAGQEGELARSMYQIRKKDSNLFGQDEPVSPIARHRAASEQLNKSYDKLAFLGQVGEKLRRQTPATELCNRFSFSSSSESRGRMLPRRRSSSSMRREQHLDPEKIY